MKKELSVLKEGIYDRPLTDLLKGALNGLNAHVPPDRALENLKLNITGRKILNTPYTIWQLIKHMNYWNGKFVGRLEGKKVKYDLTWQEGWEETLNASNQKELDKEINRLLGFVTLVKEYLEKGFPSEFRDENYDSSFHLVQAMASHLSYH